MTGAVIEGVQLLFSWPVIGFAVLGLLAGIFVGMIPGIGPAVGMTLILPFTIVLDGASAILLLTGMYMGSAYGGSVSAILMNVPGTAASAASTFDGYPMSRQGLALNALAISAMSSAIGGVIAVILMLASAPIVMEIVLLIGSPEYVLIAFLGLSMIVIVARGSLVKGITAGLFGLLIATIGPAEATPEVRFNLDTRILFDGIDLIAVVIGLFAISEMIRLSGESGGIAKTGSKLAGSVSGGIREVFRENVTIVKSGLIGWLIGILPGGGASMANFISYAESMRVNNDDDSFGTGDTRGLIAAEGANNSAVVGSFLPTLSLGIPGSVLSAILLGALIMHGIRPGPNMYSGNLDLTMSIYFALLLGAAIVIPIIGLLLVTRLGFVTKVDTNYIIVPVLVLVLFGVYAVRFNYLDIFTAIAMGVLGYFMVRYDFSIIALVLGMILGPIAEENLHRTLQLSDGSLWIFMESNTSKVMLIAIAFFLLTPIIDQLRDSNNSN